MKSWFVSLAVLLLVGTTARGVEINASAPSCPAKTLSGDEVVDPAARDGKVVYLDFWASWCLPCAQSFPFLDQLHKALAARGFEVIAVNLDEEREDALTFLRKHPVGFTVTADPEGRCPRIYDVRGMPSSYLIDRSGRIREIHLGFKESDVPEIRRQVEALLSDI